MPRLRVEFVKCVACQHFREEGISPRCTLEGNVYQNWMGVCYHKAPQNKNYNGKCPDYKTKKDHTCGREDSGKGN